MADQDPFDTHRGLLSTVAYEMLGSDTDAEDAVQETWLRWARVDHDETRDAPAHLVRIVTRQALEIPRRQARRRENYVRRWPPDWLTAPDVSENTGRALLVADGGGVAGAFLRPVAGVKRVAAMLAGLSRVAPEAQLGTLSVNSTLGVRINLDGEFDIAVTFAVENGKITPRYSIRNSHKLGGVDAPAPLARG